MNSSTDRVVITGMGTLNPLGLDTKTTWEGLVAGKSGIDYITLFDPSDMEVKFAGEVKGFVPTDYVERKEARRMDRFAQLAVAASRESVESARLEIDHTNDEDIGVIIGSGIGGLTTLFEQARILVEKGPDRVSPFLAPMMIADIAAAQISIALGIKGPNFCTTSACSSGSDAIGAAFELLRHGDAQVMLAGGTEAIINPLGITAFSSLKAISTRNDAPREASRPLDAERNGFVISEGACVLIMEKLEHALARDAQILAEIIAYSATADSFHVTQPLESGEGAAKAMRIALKKADISPTDIDYINAHGTSTQLNDAMETRAIKTVFGKRAYSIPVSSTKSHLGHLLGASGAVEIIICVKAINKSTIPPTINLDNQDERCDLKMDFVPFEAREANIDVALSNSFGFGGHNACLVVGKI